MTSRKTGDGKRETKIFIRLPPAAYRLQALALFLVSTAAAAQTTGAQVLRQPKPVYPEAASKGLRQGNVNLIGRIDTKGRVQDLRYVGSTLEAFVEPAVAAVKTWEFRPAMSGGKPIEIAANLALRFRLQGEKRGEISGPILGDLAVFPADAAGKGTAPEGFPVHRGADPRIRVEAVLDVAPDAKPRTFPVTVEALSPLGSKVVVFQQNLSVKPKAGEAKIQFSTPVASNWDDGVWLLRFVVDKTEAGGGQFWLAVDPENYRFVLPGKALVAAGEKPAPSSKSAPSRRAPTPAKTGKTKTT
jgi:TonB family protein